jgi:hypothetical protein
VSSSVNKVASTVKGATSGDTNGFLSELVDERIADEGVSKQVGDKRYNWGATADGKGKIIGDGQYGVVSLDPSTGNVVKRGSLGREEVGLIAELGKRDLGPKVVAAQVDGDGLEPKSKLGRIAMTMVEGTAIGKNREPDSKIGGINVSDAFWKARAEVHRLGIAHNDMHMGNVIVDKTGKARFVDLGLGQKSPKAALAEALGAFASPIIPLLRRGDLVKGADGEGDWQVVRWKGSGGKLLQRALSAGATQADKDALTQRAPVLSRVMGNFFKVSAEMARDGFSVQEISALVAHGIRSSDASYKKGVWAKITDDQVSKYISMLYEGV